VREAVGPAHVGCGVAAEGREGVLALDALDDDVERLLAARPGWRAASAASVLGALRMVKTPAEVERIRRAIATAVPRFEKAFASLRPGSVESEISSAFSGDNVVQFGASSALPHGASGPRTLAAGDAVLIDAWDRPEGYYYDIPRSTVFGKPTDEYRKIWSIVLHAQTAAIEERCAKPLGLSIVEAANGIVEIATLGNCRRCANA